MQDIRHTKQSDLNVVHQTIDWFDNKDYEGKTEIRNVYNPILKRWERQEKYGGLWFVYEASPATRIIDHFPGVFDLAGIGINGIITEMVHTAVLTGNGSFRAIGEEGGGMRMTTGAVLGNDDTLAGGDNTTITFLWGAERDVYFHAHFRFPMIGDFDNVYLLAGLYRDASNYVAIRYDPSGAYFPANPNLFFITRSGGVEQYTSLGVPSYGWNVVWAKVTLSQVDLCLNDHYVAKHTAHIPTDNLTHYAFIETQENAAKHFDIAHLMILQTHIGHV